MAITANSSSKPAVLFARCEVEKKNPNTRLDPFAQVSQNLKEENHYLIVIWAKFQVHILSQLA